RLRRLPRLWLHGRSGMGKSSVFAARERAYFAEDVSSLSAALRRYGFILMTLLIRKLRHLDGAGCESPRILGAGGGAPLAGTIRLCRARPRADRGHVEGRAHRPGPRRHQ